MVLSTLFRIKRTLDGAEIDEIIADVEARKAMAIEHWRRADWRKRELAASSFRAECVHAGAAALPYLAPDRNQSSVAFRIGLLGGSTRPERS